MATCLVALGSNSGDREATLDAAFAELATTGRVLRRSRLYQTRPVGGPPGQGEFLNAAAVVESSLGPLPLVEQLQRIEAQRARQRRVRWAARTLDLDLLFYDRRVIESAELTVPHPRMSFRRFVLEPAAEIAGQMVHPTIGWTIDRLLDHLDTAADRVAILSPAELQRQRLAAMLVERFAVRVIAPPASEAGPRLWPPELTTWLELNDRAAGSSPVNVAPAAGRPKLTIVLDAVVSGPSGVSTGPAAGALPADPSSETPADWPRLRLPHDRGPTLSLHAADPREIDQEAAAALQAAWPQLCPPGQNA